MNRIDRDYELWKLILILFIISMFIFSIIGHFTGKGIKIVPKNPTIIEKIVEKEVIKEVIVEKQIVVKAYRLTSYYTGDSTGSGKCTASGICTNKFKTNNKGWYTYNDKLVLASGYEYKIYDEIQIIIDNVKYDAIILDKCGACRTDTRLDLFVSNKASVIDRGYKGNNPIYVKVSDGNE